MTPTVPSEPPNRRLLIVDDDLDQLALSNTLATAAGFAVETAAGPARALEIARRTRPDAIVSDIVMPDLDGFTLCSLLRADPALAGVPVILVSAYFDEQEDRALAAHAGATDLVQRTPMFDAEIAAVRRALTGPAPSPGPRTYPETFAARMASQMAQCLSRMRAAEARYRTLLDYAQDAIALTTPDGVILDVSRVWEELRQMPREQIVGTHIRDGVASGHKEHVVADYARLVEAGRGRSTVVPIARPDGSRRYVQFSTARAYLDGQDVVLSIGRDVTETVETHQRLEASEHKYRLLVENIPDVVWLATLDGQIAYISARVETICGYSPWEIESAPPSFWFSRIHHDDVDDVRQAYARLASESTYDAEYRLQRKDGRWIWLRTRAVATVGLDGTILAEGTFADVTEYKRLGEQVRQSQKMEALGQLTGGIAHDFNNLLAVILGNGRLLLDALPEGDVRREDAQAVLDAGERAAALTRQLLMFSRRQTVKPERLSLNSVVTGMEKMLRRLIREDVNLSLRLPDRLGAVVADISEIEQIVMNLAVNARDAMPRGGRLTIETADVDLDAALAGSHGRVAAGAYVALSVADTGSGMDPETLRQAFEPFFTTKEKGRGTGLGLSTCDAIVQRYRGHISVSTERGRGTTFRIYLPRVDSPADVAAASAAAPESGGTETILLLEDDDQLRRTVHRVLTARGYRVLQSGSSTDAEAAADGCDGPVHLIVSDMVMPGLSGPDAVARLHERRPDARVLFMSGYSDHVLLRDGAESRGVNFIQKPFTPAALASKVREVLDA